MFSVKICILELPGYLQTHAQTSTVTVFSVEVFFTKRGNKKVREENIIVR